MDENTLEKSVEQSYNDYDCWGLSTSVDVYNCDPDKIRDADFIKNFVKDLCDYIEMKPFGETLVVNFGQNEKVEGFSMTQLIETSLISGHFANAFNTAYIDIFSCKFYVPKDVADFTLKAFGGDDMIYKYTLRR